MRIPLFDEECSTDLLPDQHSVGRTGRYLCLESQRGMEAKTRIQFVPLDVENRRKLFKHLTGEPKGKPKVEQFLKLF